MSGSCIKGFGIMIKNLVALDIVFVIFKYFKYLNSYSNGKIYTPLQIPLHSLKSIL